MMSHLRNLSLLVFVVILLSRWSAAAQEPLTGSLNVHDPSTMIKHGDRYYIFSTGQNIASKSSTNKLNWSNGPSVFSNSTRPGWTTNAVPGFTGNFWAPDIIYRNGLYYLYYSCSSFGSQVSAIGLVTNPSLDPADPNYLWTDQGAVIQSGSVNYNAIDPGIFQASDGRVWMPFGSFWDGIKMIELDQATGKRISVASPIYSLARRLPTTAIEAACLIQRSNYFYLFVNWDTCCSGLESTYQIRVGRSTSVTGPYLDRLNVSMYSGGGTLVLEGTGKYIGPGHAGVLPEGDTNWFTYHFYDGTTGNGTSRLAMGRLSWTDDGWPVMTNDWSAFYPFEADAREHRRQFDGTLRNGAAVTNEPGRANVLSLDGSAQYVTLPLSVANANTFAAWVKWNGGGAGQRLLDFGNGTNRYFYLTPSNAANGRLRFAIKLSSGGDQVIDAPAALPANSWCHVAVTLEGLRGLIYLNGKPVATNNSVSARPWQVQARTNYLGESQSAADPMFNGEIDSLRIYGRALNGNEIRNLAATHPSLAHRYSFTHNTSDSIGTAHGRLNGNASVTNQQLVLQGVPGDYVDLPGGLVSGCSVVTVEFWASFGVNDSWSRVFDFGNTSGANGQNFLFFSPHTGTNSHRFTLSTAGGTRDHDVVGTLDEQSVHVVCVADPAAGYTAIFTNGVLESEITGTLPPLSGVNSALAYLGRSLFSADAWLNANIDEFRIYHGRLTPEEITADHTAGPAALAIPVSVSLSNSPDALVLSWPAYAAGFVLESAPALNPVDNWSPVPEAPILEENVYRLAVPLTEESRLFRLHR